ncbi:MAG: BMP family protein [Devosia sp.]|nr:BMP family protein [Devosia sp.]
MLSKRLRRLLASLIAVPALLLVAAPLASAAPPTKLRIGIILASGVESDWEGSFIGDLEKVKKEAPHGLDISYKYSDPLWGDDAGDAMKLYAQSGQYDIIWAHSSYSDQVKVLQQQFPNIMFVVVGSGNEGLGANQYWDYKRVHEPAYLLGVLAGKSTKSGVIGAVGTYPADDVNDEINAFFAGAKSVNPALKTKVAFIESWYDPAKAAEYTSAQISTGADAILTLAGNFKPCEQAKIICFGNFRDDYQQSPSILSSTIATWTPDIHWIVDEWYKHESDGTPFTGNTDNKHWYAMKDGGSDVAPLHGRESMVPADAVKAFEEAKADILSGKLVVPLDVSDPSGK